MKNNEKGRYIYIRSTKERIPVTEQQFKDYYREIDSFRKKQQRHGCCVCPEASRLNCDMDCASCSYRKAGDNLSLDHAVSDEEGSQKSWLDSLVDPSQPVDELVADGIRMKQLIQKMSELMPQAMKIGVLRQQGYSDEAIAKEIGIPRKTFTDRLKRAKRTLENEFPEFF